MTTYQRPPADWDTSGATDLSRPLNEWLRGIPDGTVVDFTATPSLRCDDAPPTIADRAGVQVLGFTAHTTRDGNLDRNGRSSRSHLRLVRCSDVTLFNPTVRGVNTPDPGAPGFNRHRPVFEAEHGIELLSCAGTTIVNLVAENVCGDNVYASAHDPKRPVPTTNLHVIGGRGTGNGRQGFALAFADGVTVAGFTVTNSRRSAFDLEPNTNNGFVRNVDILGGYYRANLLAFPSKGKGDVSHITIDGAHIDSGTPGVFCATPLGFNGRRHDWTVRGVTGRVNASDRFAVEFHNVDGVTVEGCDLDVPRKNAVLLNRCGGDLTTTGNDFRGRVIEVRDPLTEPDRIDNRDNI